MSETVAFEWQQMKVGDLLDALMQAIAAARAAIGARYPDVAALVAADDVAEELG